MKPLHFPWVSVTVKIDQHFLLIFLLKIQTLLCNVSSFVLVLGFSLSELEECHLLIDSSLQYFIPLPCEGSHSSLSLSYLVGCDKLMWLNVATVLNQASAFTSSIKWCCFVFLICFKVREQDFHLGTWASPSPCPLFKSLRKSGVFLWFHHHFLPSCRN